MNRGMDLFKATVMEEIVASEQFLVLLLENIEEWARSVGTQVSVYQTLYQELKEQGVTFPVYSAAQVELNRLRAMKPQEVAAFMRAELEAQREAPEKVHIHVEILREKQQDLLQTAQMATLNQMAMEALVACSEEINQLLTLADTYRQVKRPSKVHSKPPVPASAPINRSSELVAKAIENWAALLEPSTASAPAALDSDNEDALDKALRPDLEDMGAVSLRQSRNFRTLKGRKGPNDDLVGDI